MQEQYFTLYRETDKVSLDGHPYTLQNFFKEELTKGRKRRTVYADISANLQCLFKGVYFKNIISNTPYTERRSA